eukprot:6481227-Prorocentrum_lima.AAC.1
MAVYKAADNYSLLRRHDPQQADATQAYTQRSLTAFPPGFVFLMSSVDASATVTPILPRILARY